jgi:hypothetical protein
MTVQLDLSAEEKEALIALLKRTLEYARFPLAPRLDPRRGWWRMRRAVGIVVILLFVGCQQQSELSITTLGTLPEGQECDPRAIAELIARENPGVDTARVQQEVDHSLSEARCDQTAPTSSEPTPTPLTTPPSVSTSSDEITIERSGDAYIVPFALIRQLLFRSF